jgi:hypothetical protein
MLSALNKFKKNIFSQYGDDGIIEEIFHRLENKVNLNKTFCEFGAWDGIHLSNTFNLYKNKKFKGVLIEPDNLRFKQLCKNIPDKKIIKINSFVTFEGSGTLENILKARYIDSNIDFISIDVDGCDYYIFETLQNLEAKIICVEFNPTIPNEVEFIQEKNFSLKQGCSPLSLKKLGEKMGYDLIASTHNNLFFSKKNLTDYIVDNKPSLDELRDDSSIKNYIFYGYDGSVLNSKLIELPWHRVTKKNINILPNFLRKYPSDYNNLQKICFYLLKFFNKPKKYLVNLKKYLLLFFSKF